MDLGGEFRDISEAPECPGNSYVPKKGVLAEDARHPLERVIKNALAHLLPSFSVSGEDDILKRIALEGIAGRYVLVVEAYGDA